MDNPFAKNKFLTYLVWFLSIIALVVAIASDGANIWDRLTGTYQEEKTPPATNKSYQILSQPKEQENYKNGIFKASNDVILTFSKDTSLLIISEKGTFLIGTTTDTLRHEPLRYVRNFIIYNNINKMLIEFNDDIPPLEIKINNKFRRGQFFDYLSAIRLSNVNISYTVKRFHPLHHTLFILIACAFILLAISGKTSELWGLFCAIFGGICMIGALITTLFLFL